MHRFFVAAEAFEDDMVRFSSEQRHQLGKVLRLEAGQRVVVLDNTGAEYEVELTVHLAGRVIDKRQVRAEPAVEVTLFQGMLKRDKFEWVLQKCTEIGISAFVPVVTSRSLVQDTRVKTSKIQRWQKILTEAAEQCGRGRVPRLDEPIKLGRAVEQFEQFDKVLVAWEQAQPGLGIRDALAQTQPVQRIGIVIGPEGGLREQEVQQCRQAGAELVSLGRRILRTETAAVAAAVLVMDQLEAEAERI